MISVITPCLNIYKNGRSKYFERMMNSVHNQTWTDLEHIVIDGDSTDETIEILRQYQKRGWINHLISEKDNGIYSAINKGVATSKGEFLQIMNTDDYFLNLNYFEKCIDVLQDKGIDFTHADRIIKSRERKPDYIKRGNEGIAFFKMPFRHQTMVVKRAVFDETGSFDESYKIAADYKFVLQMLLADKKGYHFSETVLCSLDGGVSSDREKCTQEVSRVIFEIYGQNNSLSLNDCKAIYLREITPSLYSKILKNVKNLKILDSLRICYQQSKTEYPKSIQFS